MPKATAPSVQEGLAPGFLISGPVSFLIPVPCHHLDVVGSVVHLVPYETLSVTIHVIFLSPWKTGSTPVGDAERPPGKPEPELRHRLRSQDSLPGSSLHLRAAPSSAHRCHHTRGGRVLPVPTHLAGGHLLCSAEEHSRGCQGKAKCSFSQHVQKGHRAGPSHPRKCGTMGGAQTSSSEGPGFES